MSFKMFNNKKLKSKSFKQRASGRMTLLSVPLSRRSRKKYESYQFTQNPQQKIDIMYDPIISKRLDQLALRPVR